MSTAENIDPFVFTDNAANKVKELIEEEGNPALKLRVFVTGGGCSGFQYGFTFDEEVAEDDTTMEKNGVQLLIDPMSYQYLSAPRLITRMAWKAPSSSSATPTPLQPAAAVRPSRSDRQQAAPHATKVTRANGSLVHQPPSSTLSGHVRTEQHSLQTS